MFHATYVILILILISILIFYYGQIRVISQNINVHSGM
jgi:hypothetical protein